MEIISRQEAIKKELIYYFTGIPCLRGHICKRSVYNSTCYICKCDARTKYDNNNRDRKRERERNYYLRKNKTLVAIPYDFSENKEDYKSKINKRCKMSTSYSALRRSRKLTATPLWADLNAIKNFYMTCPKNKVVDHIIPLKGKLVSGLHLVENLQYLSNVENCSKNNKFEPYTSTNTTIQYTP